MYITDMSFVPEKNSSELVSGPSMHFWGITCEEGKRYAQVVGVRFHVTMAVLDPKSARKGENKAVSLMVERNQHVYLLCILKHEEIQQVNLNLIFDKGENVIFYIKGCGNICLSGYQLTDVERDFLNDDSEYLCPLVEVKPSKSKSEEKLPKTPGEQSDFVTPKSKKKAKKENEVTSEDRERLNSWNIRSNRHRNGDMNILEYNDESDETDEDYSVDEESSESDIEELDQKQIDEELVEEISKLKDDEEYEEDNEEPKMKEENAGSRKRKFEKSKQEENSFNENVFKDSSESDVVALSEDETPISKKTKKIENNSEKKKSKKKKKKLNESTSSEKFMAENSPRTVFSAETTPQKNPVLKMGGGVEATDLTVGKGPVATKGKMLHVFFVGRLENKEIFDTRLPGKKPLCFKLGDNQVLKGWDVGLQGMRVGGKRKLKVPPHMGYGNSRARQVPPNSTLYFTVELQAVS